jgi:hypothetical protein
MLNGLQLKIRLGKVVAQRLKYYLTIFNGT